MPWAGNPDAIKVGPGFLWFGPLDAVEPTDLVTEWDTVDVDWIPVGYTEEGHSFTNEVSNEAIEVAEELDPIRYEQTRRENTLTFTAAQMTVDNIVKAYNGGTITTGTGIVTFEPPPLGDVTRIKIGWEALDGTERWVFRRCLQTGNTEIARRKAPTKATIPMTFRCEKPAGATAFKAIFAD